MQTKKSNLSTDIQYWIAFSYINGIGPQKIKLIYNHFSSLKDAWQAPKEEYFKIGLNTKDIHALNEARNKLIPEKLYNDIIKNKINIVTLKDNNYPLLLREIYSPPPILYYKGKLPDNSNMSLGVVGTRKTSIYGRQASLDLVSILAKTGLIIVSGLALGIDTLAHQTTLKYGGITMAILGCGLDIIYPSSNYQLAKNIVFNGGCIISEYPPGTKPLKQHFPARNRIIAGITKGVLVIEGGHKSGSLITARFSLDYNREVMAIPGSIFNTNAEGTNHLLKNGAHLISNAEDVLNVLDLQYIQKYKETQQALPKNSEEKILYEIITKSPIHIDEIIQQCKLQISIINATLTIMEMKGLIKNLGGGNFIRN
ncbi:MAG: DNA-processing protein DprA [Candidatus Kerfeldbacteria bacterium]